MAKQPRFLSSLAPMKLHNGGQNILLAFTRWLNTSKRYVLPFGICLCYLFIVWLVSRFNGGCHKHGLPSILGVVVVVVAVAIFAQQPSSSESLGESNIFRQYFDYIFKKECHGSIWQRDEKDMLGEIVMKLHTFHDFAMFSCVCRSWRSVCSDLNWCLRPPHPWSIHFQDTNILNRLDDGKFVLERWEINGRYYYGCVRGWILSIGSQHIHLFNLFSRTQAKFPMLSHASYLQITNRNDWYRYIEKFILFKQCEGDDHPGIAVALFGSRDFIGFTRTSSQDWVILKKSDIDFFEDVLVFQGQFYALCDKGKLVHCAFEKSDRSISLLSQEPLGIPKAKRYYLVMNEGHMIGVFQYGNENSGGMRFNTTHFRIYRFEAGDWTPISQPNYLEGLALFIDNGNSWTIDSQKIPNCRTNSIYLTDKYWIASSGDGHYTGMYDIVERNFEEFLSEEEDYRAPNNPTPFLLTFSGGS